MRHRFIHSIWLPLLLVLSLVSPGLCGFIHESHACCHGGGSSSHPTAIEATRLRDADSSCCFISTVHAVLSRHSVQDLSGAPDLVSPPAAGYGMLTPTGLHRQQGLLAQGFLADQSERHKWLGVWLN